MDAPTIAHSPAARQRSVSLRPSTTTKRRSSLRWLSPGRDSSVPRASFATSLSPASLRALHSDEAVRARGFGRLGALISLITVPLFPTLDGPRWLRLLTMGTVAAFGVLGAWVWLRGAADDRYSRRVFRTFGVASIAMSLMVHYYFGVISPTPVLTTIGITFFGLGDDRRFALLLSGGAILGYLALVVLLLLGVIPDYGLLSPATPSLAPRLFMAIAVPSCLGVVLWHARLSRRATHEAIQRAQDAMREAQRREALAEEANIGLDRVLQAGAGQVGYRSGQQVGGYVLAELLGRGGMGEVYAAMQLETGNRAAVKLLNSWALEKPEMLERFAREAKMTAGLHSPNVVEVFEFGTNSEGAPFIAMELLRGQNLGALLRQRTQLLMDEVLVLVEEVGRGLTAAHEGGVVHRDLKPQNLFHALDKSERGTWKILDFGVSKMVGSSGTLTDVALVGTPGYMAPEQAQGREAGPRSDIFALGAVAYRALTGRPPFSGPDVPQILFEIVYRSPPRPSELVPHLPADVDLVLALALAKRAEHRFETVAEFAAALVLASQGRLPAPLRDRAKAAVAKLPWGRKVRGRND
jgi:serine/threonine-protein kinase